MPNLIISSIIFSIQGLQHRKNVQAKSNSQYIMWVNKSRNLCHTRVPSCIFKKSLWCQEKVSCGFSSTGTIFNSIYDMLYLIRLNVSSFRNIARLCLKKFALMLSKNIHHSQLQMNANTYPVKLAHQMMCNQRNSINQSSKR